MSSSLIPSGANSPFSRRWMMLSGDSLPASTSSWTPRRMSARRWSISACLARTSSTVFWLAPLITLSRSSGVTSYPSSTPSVCHWRTSSSVRVPASSSASRRLNSWARPAAILVGVMGDVAAWYIFDPTKPAPLWPMAVTPSAVAWARESTSHLPRATPPPRYSPAVSDTGSMAATVALRPMLRTPEVAALKTGSA